jgi:hypothetical protein
MRLTVRRNPTDAGATLGELAVDGVLFCLTLEDPIRVDDPLTPVNEGEKIYGDTAIPAGIYPMKITFSPKFQKRMILVDAVPGFTGIRIHSGNTSADTLGCILVGMAKDSSKRISGGSIIMPRLFELVDKAISAGQTCSIEIINPEVSDGN